MPKIAIDARIINTTTGRYVERLLRHLQEIDNDNEYLVLLQKKDFAQWDPTSKNFKKVLADYPIYSWGEQTRLGGQLKDLNPDLVHFTMPQQPLAYLGKKVTTVHDLTLVNFVNKRAEPMLKAIYKHQIKPAVFKFALKRAVKSSKFVITPTEFVRGQIIDKYGVGESKVIATHEAADALAATPKTYDYLKGKDFILYVGNAYPYKNLKRLIQAFDKAGTNHQLVLVGKKDFFYAELEKYVKRKLIRNVTFTGFVPDEELAWMYQHATAYVFPSLSEGFGLPGLEAMEYGLPVASSNATCLPEVYGEAAMYFDPNDTADMARVIKELVDNPQLRKDLTAKGKEQVKKYSWRKMAEETLEVYKQALKS